MTTYPPQTRPQPCTCGDREPHVIAERRTADGMTVCLWSDGDVTGRLGIYPRGLGHIRNPGPRAVRAGWLVMDDVCLYDWADLPRLVKIARRALAQVCLPSAQYIRRAMAGERFHFDGRVLRAVRS